MLDEATAALDEKSQGIVQQTLEGVMRRCTSIVIAHRLSGMTTCDRLIRISEGVAMDQDKMKHLSN
jgi:ABC-type multidrug transport system fused ATPase/permease subunit